MNFDDSPNVRTVENQAFALATRFHVLMRREKIRVTDVEYMTQDRAYCRHVLDLARRTESADLREVCSKLDALYFGADGIFVRTPKAPEPPLATHDGYAAGPDTHQAVPVPSKKPADRYIGRLR